MGFLDNLPLSYKLDYEGGHPGIIKDGEVTFTLQGEKITVTKGLIGGSFNFLISNVSNIRFETQHEIESRFTATRIALLGPFALAFKKKKDIKHKYLTIEFTGKDMEYIVVFTGANAQRVHALLMERVAKYRQGNIKNNVGEEKSNDSDMSKKLREIKALLDEGILSQEEFDEQKRRILNN